MFEQRGEAGTAGWVTILNTVRRDLTDAERIDAIRGLEDLKAAAAAAQARLSADLDSSQRRAQALAGLPARRRGEGIAAQLGLARRDRSVAPSTSVSPRS